MATTIEPTKVKSRQSDGRPDLSIRYTQSATNASKSLRSAHWLRHVVNTLPLILADIAAHGIGIALLVGVASVTSIRSPLDLNHLIVLTGLTASLTFVLFGLYPGVGLNAVAELTHVAFATMILFVVYVMAGYRHEQDLASIGLLMVACASITVLVCLFRTLAKGLASRLPAWGEPVLIFGKGKTAAELYDYYFSKRQLGIRPIAVIDESSEQLRRDCRQRGLSIADYVAQLREKHDIDMAVFTTNLSDGSVATVRQCLARFPHVLLVPEASGLPSIHRQMMDCGDHVAIPMTNSLLLAFPRTIKTVMDYALVLAGGLACLPLILAVGLLIKVTSPGPVFYSQTRIGRGNRTFRAWKFRTMAVDAEQRLQQYLDTNPELREEWKRDHKLKDDPRVTSIGRWLRKTSLDELPQLWNIIRGEMSLVGPRPIVSDEIEKYGDWFELYARVTPGITGLWQTSGRNNTTYDMRVAYDSYYVLNWSPWLDLLILARTAQVVCRREGAY